MKTYQNKNISVSFDKSKCIHAGSCVQQLPAVFDVNKTPWINIDGASKEKIVQAVNNCPSGALSYQLTNDQAAATDSPRLKIKIMDKGPYLIEGDVTQCH